MFASAMKHIAARIAPALLKPGVTPWLKCLHEVTIRTKAVIAWACVHLIAMSRMCIYPNAVPSSLIVQTAFSLNKPSHLRELFEPNKPEMLLCHSYVVGNLPVPTFCFARASYMSLSVATAQVYGCLSLYQPYSSLSVWLHGIFWLVKVLSWVQAAEVEDQAQKLWQPSPPAQPVVILPEALQQPRDGYKGAPLALNNLVWPFPKQKN